MKAIQTRYHGPGNVRGARITARDADGNQATIPYPYHLNGGEDAHRLAAEALCRKMGWGGPMIGGGLRDGYVFVFVPTDYPSTGSDGPFVQAPAPAEGGRS